MPEVMQPRAPTCICRTQADTARQRVEGAVQARLIQPVAATGHEDIGRDCGTEELGAPAQVVRQHIPRGRMQRDAPDLAELGAADGQQGLVEIDVGNLQVQHLGHPHAGRAQQADQAVVLPRVQRCAVPVRRQPQGGGQQLLHFLVRIQVRPGACGPVGQQAHGRDLCQGIAGMAVAREASNSTQAPRPLRRLRGGRLLRPLHRQRRRDVRRAAGLEEVDEPRQLQARVFQLVAQAAAQLEIVAQGLSKRAHDELPGHGRANGRSAARSTLA
jgi:hypothetical protein